MPTEKRCDRLLDRSAHEPSLLHDRNGVRLLDPRHDDAHPLDLAAGRQQDWRLVGDEQATVEERGLARDELRAQARQVTDVLVLPEEQGVKARNVHLRSCLRDPLLA